MRYACRLCVPPSTYSGCAGRETSHSALELTKTDAGALEQKNRQLEQRLAALSASSPLASFARTQRQPRSLLTSIGDIWSFLRSTRIFLLRIAFVLLALAVLRYLQTVEMGLLGGLNYAAYTDPTRGGTTDYIVRNQCLNRNWESGGVNDECIIKWDGYDRTPLPTALCPH